MGIVSFLYQLSRKARDLEVVSSGSGKKIARRLKNKQIGRRTGKLWKFPF